MNTRKILTVVTMGLLLSTTAFAAKETIECARFGTPSKLRPVNAVAIRVAKALNVKTCEASSFINYGKRNFNFKEVKATPAMIKAYSDAQYKAIENKMKKKTNKKLW